jgi:hypothetical protein
MQKSRSTLLFLALLASAAGGCGGGSDPVSEEPLTKAQFIKRAEAICSGTDKTQKAALRVFFQKHPNATASKAVEEEVVVVVGLPPVRAEIKELAALPAPKGDEEKIQAFIEAIEQAVEKGEADPSTMIRGEGKGPFAAAGKLARGYGFKACTLPL